MSGVPRDRRILINVRTIVINRIFVNKGAIKEEQG